MHRRFDAKAVMRVAVQRGRWEVVGGRFDARGSARSWKCESGRAVTMESKEDDFFFDEIGSVLKIKQLRAEKRELLENMETYFRVFFLQEGQDVISD